MPIHYRIDPPRRKQQFTPRVNATLAAIRGEQMNGAAALKGLAMLPVLYVLGVLLMCM